MDIYRTGTYRALQGMCSTGSLKVEPESPSEPLTSMTEVQEAKVSCCDLDRQAGWELEAGGFELWALWSQPRLTNSDFFQPADIREATRQGKWEGDVHLVVLWAQKHRLDITVLLGALNQYCRVEEGGDMKGYHLPGTQHTLSPSWAPSSDL